MSKTAEEMEGIKNIIEFIAQSYRASELSEVKGLPSKDDAIREANKSYNSIFPSECSHDIIVSSSWSSCWNWMRSIAQQVIAKKDEELDKVRASKDILSFATDNLLKENAYLKNELNKAKDEIEVFRKGFNALEQTFNESVKQNKLLSDEIERLKGASIKLFNMVHESDLIENKIKANDLYDIIK